MIAAPDAMIEKQPDSPIMEDTYNGTVRIFEQYEDVYALQIFARFRTAPGGRTAPHIATASLDLDCWRELRAAADRAITQLETPMPERPPAPAPKRESLETRIRRGIREQGLSDDKVVIMAARFPTAAPSDAARKPRRRRNPKERT
jgi:hypothetical protein